MKFIIATVAVSLVSVSAAELVPFRSAGWKYLMGTQEASNPTSLWRTNDFNDAAWLGGVAPIGYPSSDASELEASIQTQLPPSASSGYSCVFLRKSFVVEHPEAAVGLNLQARYDDGFAVWLNGVLVGSTGVGEPFTIGTLAADHEVTVSETALTPSPGLLRTGTNVLAVQVFNASMSSADLFLDAQLSSVADEAPTITSVFPTPSAVVQSLSFLNVVFSENVSGVDAADLLIDSLAATNVVQNNPRDYTFYFSEPPTGAVTVAWIPNPGISDLDGAPLAFAPGTPWLFTLDPVLNPVAVISEFMADNVSGLKDDDGVRSDWIEIFNPGPLALSLEGWFLTDSITNLTQWRFPSRILEPNSYMLVWASGKNRTDPLKPLHTNFRLEKNGEYLALIDPTTNIVSAFAPAYPAQPANISYGRDRADLSLLGYYETPTPGAQNATSGPGFAVEPMFSVGNGVFTNDTITIALTAMNEIRYTLDGSMPTNTSLLYTGPITVGSNAVLRARSFEAGKWPSPVVSRVYHFLDVSARDFNSNLPLMILSTAGRPIVDGVAPGLPRTPGALVVIDTFRGRSSLTSAPEFSGLAEFEIFGQTSAGFPKRPYRIEIQDELRNDRRVPLLGMPAEADWKLRNPYADKCLMNDFLALELHEQMGHYAVRRRFVEVFVDSGGGKVTYPQDYVGVMVLMETIETGPDRVAIHEVTPFHTKEPEITGGYIWKKEKDSQGDLNFTAAGQVFKIHEPKPTELRNNRTSAITTWPGPGYTPAAGNQLSYLVNYLNAFNTSMLAGDWLTRTGTNHYSHYIDVDSFVDQHWIVEFTKNIDGYRLGNYMHKDRGGKIKMDPIWDWELSFGNADYLTGGSTSTWYYTQLSTTDHVWLRRLLGGAPLPGSGGDPDFIQRVIDRWGGLRTNVLSGDRVTSRIDEISSALAEAAGRNFARYNNYLNTYVWPNPMGPPAWDVDYTQPTYAGIISEMKKWTMGRFLWIDGQLPRSPVLEVPEGDIASGTLLTIGAPAGAVFYTLDGTDPRAMQAGGAVASGAITYAGPIALQDNARVFARARVGNVWSPPAIATYVVRRPGLIISEIMYHPPPPAVGTNSAEDFEYIEVKNVGATALDLDRFTIGGGVEFVFPPMTLPAGQRAVVVKDLSAFVSRYGDNVTIAGQYSGTLADEGERLFLSGKLRELLMDFFYDDAWYPTTDGLGFSLAAVEDTASGGDWSQASSWRPCGAFAGTPGLGEPPVSVIPKVVINEALTHSGPPQPSDAIELLNLSSEPADVSGWYLTDDLRVPKKFRIPTATPAISPGGLLVFFETVFGDDDEFSLSAAGDEVYLFSADASGELTGYVHGFAFGAQRSGVTFVRLVGSDGREHFVSSSASTVGTPNAPPLVGPLIISEIMYRPPEVFANGAYWDNFEDEFIELHNITTAPVQLFDPVLSGATWRLEGGVGFVFPPDVSVAAGGYLILVGFDPVANPAQLSAFRTKYGLSPATPIYGPYSGRLSNMEQTVTLSSPDASSDGTISYVPRDSVSYRHRTPWPSSPDGAGHSLSRVNESAFGDDPVNWVAGNPNPGTAVTTGSIPVITLNPANVTVGATATASFFGEGVGVGPLRYQWLFNGELLSGATNATLELPNVQRAQSGRYRLVVLNPFGSAISTEAVLTVLAPVRIHQHPADQSVMVGTAISLSVVAESFNPPLSYLWLRDGRPILDATNSTYVIAHAGDAEDGAVFAARVTDRSGTFETRSARMTVLIPPQLLEPIPKLLVSGVAGETLVLGTRLRGTRPIWINWRKFSLTGQNQGLIKSGFITNLQDFLVLSNINSSAAGTYCVLFTNIAGGGLNQAGLRTNAILTVEVDVNQNGIADSWEARYFGSPTGADRDADSDGDTLDNWSEYVAGTDPLDPASFLKIEAGILGSTVSLQLGAVSNRTYSVQYADSLTPAHWQRLADISARATNRVETVLDSGFASPRFYRVITPRQP